MLLKVGPVPLRHWLLLLVVAAILSGCRNEEPDVPQPQLPTMAPTTAGEDSTSSVRCTETDPHPVGQSISETFDVSYEEVMTLFCNGHAFEDILLALQTSEISGQPAEVLLARHEELTWDQIWEETGIVEP